MSVFTSRVTKVVAIQHDEGQSATIRKLNPKALGRAAKAAQIASVQMLRDMGGPAFVKELRGLGDSTEEIQKKVEAAKQADPMMLFDRDELLTAGVVSWTYPEPVSPESLEDLDDDVQESLAREVLRLAKPSLFASVELDTKNA